MRRFVLRHDIERLRSALGLDLSERERTHITAEVARMIRELASLDAAYMGAQRYPQEFGRLTDSDRALLEGLTEARADPTMILDPRAGLHILDVNAAHSAATFKRRKDVVGARLFDVFPGNPATDGAGGSAGLLRALQDTCRDRRPVATAPQRYDVQDRSGVFVPCFWQTVSRPILDDEGRVIAIVHEARNVTERMTRWLAEPRQAITVGA